MDMAVPMADKRMELLAASPHLNQEAHFQEERLTHSGRGSWEREKDLERERYREIQYLKGKGVREQEKDRRSRLRLWIQGRLSPGPHVSHFRAPGNPAPFTPMLQWPWVSPACNRRP